MPHTRRDFVSLAATGISGALLARFGVAAEPGLVARIETVTLRRGRDGSGPTWFHPRACLIPGDQSSTVFMTLQTIAGSDYFGPVNWMTSGDLGRTWTEPQPVPALGRVRQADGSEEGVCDVVPEWHAPSKSVLALGHNVFYSGPRFSADQPPRWPVYAVWCNGEWGPRRKLDWTDPRGAQIYTNNCGQRVVLPTGDILLAFTYGSVKNKPRSVSSVICSFDGEILAVKQVGEEILHDKGRGLLEPSLTQYENRFFLTLRAEDNRGYVCASDDGLKWTPKQPSAWDDGEPLTMSTTQQHWLNHSDALWLVYTRKDPSNVNVIRWRSPLWMAQVDTKSLRLRRDTEQVVLPLVGDGVNNPDKVALMGNFHPVNISRTESWVTVGEWQPKNGIKGDLLLARIQWSRPNRLTAVHSDLRVVTDFEGGNAEVVSLDPATSTVRIMPALHEGRGWPCWWSLKLEGVTVGQTVTLEVQAQTQPYAPGRKLAATWCQPKHAAVSTDNIHWKPSAKAEFAADKAARYTIPVTANPTWIAWGPPFLPSHAEALIKDLEAKVPGSKTFELARTRGGRSVPGIRIGAVDALRQVWIGARQHAWETGGSWVGRGLIEWIASDDPAAKRLRAQTCLHFIPIMDVDNVSIGAGGKDAIPRDHNRDWAGAGTDPGPDTDSANLARPIYPEVAAAQRRILEIESRHGLDVYIDLHNPGHDDPIFFFGPFDIDSMTAVPKRNYSRWIELAAQQMKEPLAVQPKYKLASYVTTQEERSRMSSVWVREHTGEQAISVTLETAWNSAVITQESYQAVGRQLGRTLAEYLLEDPRRAP